MTAMKNWVKLSQPLRFEMENGCVTFYFPLFSKNFWQSRKFSTFWFIFLVCPPKSQIFFTTKTTLQALVERHFDRAGDEAAARVHAFRSFSWKSIFRFFFENLRYKISMSIFIFFRSESLNFFERFPFQFFSISNLKQKSSHSSRECCALVTEQRRTNPEIRNFAFA